MRNKSFISLILVFASLVCISTSFAYAENTDGEKADVRASYLDFDTPYIICESGPLEGFIAHLLSKEITDNSKLKTDPDSESCCRYISYIADECNLVEYGTFSLSENIDDFRSFLVNINQFKYYSSDYRKLSNDHEAEVGDVVIYDDCPGIVYEKGKALFVSRDFELLSCPLKSLGQVEVIDIVYPYYEHLAFLYMINELGFSKAMACGVLANIHCESLCDPDTEEASNKMGYGICQWSKERRIYFNYYCRKNGLSPTSLYTQLGFMNKELKEDFEDLDYTLSKYASEDAEGANDAAYYFCYYYENPNETTDTSIERGVLAEDTYWPLYGGLSP